MYTQLSSNDVSTAAAYGAGGAPVSGVAAASSAAAYGRPVSGAGAFALAHGAPGTPPPAMPPPVLSRLSEDTYAFGNETMGYFYIPRASLGDAAETSAKASAKKTCLVDAGDDAQDETRDAATGGSDARKRASSREGKQSVSEPIPRAVLAAAAAAAKAAYGHSASPPGARTPPPPKPASGAGYAAYSPGFDPASALGFSPFVPPSPGPFSPAAARFPEPVDPSRPPFARASPSEERKAPARASSFLTFAAAAMARKRAGEADAGSVTEHKASGEAADAAEEEATNRDATNRVASSDASSDASPPGPERDEGGVLSGFWGPSGPSTPGGSPPFPGSDYPYPEGYGYALPASLSASPQVAAAAAYAYEAEYANAMRAWSLANPEVSGLAEVADALSLRGASLRSTPAGTPPGGASPAASSVSSRAASPTFPPRHQVGPFAYPSSGDARWFAHPPAGPLRSGFPLSPPGFGVEAGPYAADGMYPPSPPAGWFPRADGGGVHGVHGAFYAGPSFGAYGHAVSPRNGSSRRAKHRRDKDIAANRRDALSPLAASLRDTRSRALANRAGLGSASGAVLVGSGGDGLGEATRGPRAAAAAAAAASAASEDAKRSETAASVAQELVKTSPVHDVASSLDAADASSTSAARAPSLAASRAARAGVAADPEFRDAVWRRADRNVPMADSKELCDRFDGAGLEGLDFASGHDRFFVIKSYTEDDVHKSVKYGKWTSTATGNARLDAAFSRNGDDDGDENEDVFGGAKTVDAAFLELARAAERALEERNRKERGRRDDADVDVEKARRETAEAEAETEAETQETSPPADRSDDASEDDSDDALRSTRRRPRVLLFFSVNSSGHFCGVAEMLSAVDHDARADFWQRDKWPGCFDVRWHYVKDVPNASLRHIRLVESDRKPVTNARDAQEVEPTSARLVLNVFRNFTTNTSLLDDFEFYGAREKARADIKSAKEKARDDGERGTGKTGANANGFVGSVASRSRRFSNGSASVTSVSPAVVFPGSHRYPYVQTLCGTYFSTEHGHLGDATRFPYGTNRVNPSPLAYGHSVAGDPRGAPFARAAQSMSASAPAFAPGGLRGAGSRYDTSSGSPYGSGASLSSRGPKFEPAQPERNAPKASPYRDAVGAR